jgi:hypothetical protein
MSRSKDPLNEAGFGNGSVVREYALTALLVLQSLMLFVASPLAAMGMRAPFLVGGLLLVPLASAIVIVAPDPRVRMVAVTAAATAVAGAVARIRHASFDTIWFGHISAILAIVAVSTAVAQATFAPGRITHHRLEGAVILYLNIALIFTSAYRLILELDPTSFSNMASGQTEAAALNSMLYFSFTTLTSTGYGDVSPLHPIARSLSNLEAILGQMYLAILLARLVTLHLNSRQ